MTVGKIESKLQHSSTYFIMILNHNKFIINVDQMIKVTMTQQMNKKYESIILNHH
jgi:hypothetical protein